MIRPIFRFIFIGLLAVGAGLLAAPAFASNNNNGPNCTGNNACATNTTNNITNKGGEGGNASANATGGSVGDIKNTNTNLNSNTNVLGQSQGQAQGQKQGQAQLQGQAQGQGQSQSATASNSGNAQSTTVTINEAEQKRQAASGPGIGSSPSATCRVAGGISIGLPGGNGGVFGSIEDERCADMERGRHLAEVLGRRDAAHRLACRDAKMAEALGDCPKAKTAEATAVQPTTGGRDPFRYSGY